MTNILLEATTQGAGISILVPFVLYLAYQVLFKGKAKQDEIDKGK